MNDFVLGYIECALWSEAAYLDGENDDRSFEQLNYDIDDLAPEALKEIEDDCQDFMEANADDLEKYCRSGHPRHRNSEALALAGHDFWLTRNGHGAGFWDRGSGELGERLADAARVYGSTYLYLGDDGMIHCD